MSKISPADPSEMIRALFIAPKKETLNARAIVKSAYPHLDLEYASNLGQAIEHYFHKPGYADQPFEMIFLAANSLKTSLEICEWMVGEKKAHGFVVPSVAILSASTTNEVISALATRKLVLPEEQIFYRGKISLLSWAVEKMLKIENPAPVIEAPTRPNGQAIDPAPSPGDRAPR